MTETNEITALANIYTEAARSIRRRKSGAGDEGDFPNSQEGVRGMLFVEAALASSQNGGKWTVLGSE